MQTIIQHTRTLRTLLKNYSDDTTYSDTFLYKLLVDASAILKEREAKKFNKVSDFLYQSFCTPLVLDSYHDCDCIPDGLDCKVRKSTFEIPEPIYGRNKALLRVKKVDGTRISYVSDSSEIKKLKYSKTQKNKIKYTISNNKIVIFNDVKIGVILVEGVFVNPLDLAGISVCSPDGLVTSDPCYDLATSEFPMKTSQNLAMYQEVLNMLKIPLQLTDDILNNAKQDNA